MQLKDYYSSKLFVLKNNNIENPRLDLDLIFSEVLGLQKHELITNDEVQLSANDMSDIDNLVKRRSLGEPVAYLFSYKHFYKSKFYVDKNVLVPRPETELLVEKSLQLFSNKSAINILDLGCGSGCIGLSLLAEFPNSKLTAIDISEEAISITKKNYQLLNLNNDINYVCTNIRNLDTFVYQNKFDLIVANPPYIDTRDGYVQDSVKRYEPNIALFSEERGLSDVFLWTQKAGNWLKNGGRFLLEFGDDQCQEIVNFFESLDFFVEYSVHRDYSDLDRYIVARKC